MSKFRRRLALITLLMVLVVVVVMWYSLDLSSRPLSVLQSSANRPEVAGAAATAGLTNEDTGNFSLSVLQSSANRPEVAGAAATAGLTNEDTVNFLEEECEMCDHSFVMDKDWLNNDPVERTHGQVDKIPLYRHYTGHKPWPALQQLDMTLPGKVPPTVHYLWCKTDAWLGFHHYLGILSAVRHFQPIKFVFHYRQLPTLNHDMYYSWFTELKQSLPGLVLRPMPTPVPACSSPDILGFALSLLQHDGGILLGSNVIVSRASLDINRQPFWVAFAPPWPSKQQADQQGAQQEGTNADFTRMVVIAKRGFSDTERDNFTKQILAFTSQSPSSRPSSMTSSPRKCLTREDFNAYAPDSQLNADCVTVQDKPPLYPVDIMYDNSSFAQLARWLFYGTRRPMNPITKLGEPIPRISHLNWFNPFGTEPYEMRFYQFLTVLSALYVGGFEHVYIHGNAGFRGRWWDALKKENVTFVFMDDPESVFQQKVSDLAHKSDVTRYAILYKYGGAYHDFEAMWTSRVPDWLLDYPCVASSDWAAYGDFPDGINIGVMMAKRHAPWLHYILASHRYYVDSNFVWNSILMSYKTYERHPDQLLHYRRLQVMCDLGICHPSWEPGFRRDINDKRKTIPFDWSKDTLVVHVTRPDPEKSFLSPEQLKGATDMFGEIGRSILKKSGHMDLLG